MFHSINTKEDFKRNAKILMKELNGGLADIGSWIPLFVAPTFAIQANKMMFWNGIQSIAMGLIYNAPIVVQPMTSIMAISLSHDYSFAQVQIAGLIVSLIVLILAYLDLISLLKKKIPSILIDSLLTGVGLSLCIKGHKYISSTGTNGEHGWWLAIVCAIFLSFKYHHYLKKIPVVVLLTIIITSIYCSMQLPNSFKDCFDVYFGFKVMDGQDWINAIFDMALTQLPLTLLNSVLLSTEYCFSNFTTNLDSENNENIFSHCQLATTIFIQNVLCVFFGAFPSCHGASGIIQQHTFGSEKGFGMICVGLIKIIFSFFLVWRNFPIAVVGIMVVFTGFEMVLKGISSFVEINTPHNDQNDDLKERCIVFCSTSIVIGLTNAWIGLIVGSLAYILTQHSSFKKNNDKMNL